VYFSISTRQELEYAFLYPYADQAWDMPAPRKAMDFFAAGKALISLNAPHAPHPGPYAGKQIQIGGLFL